MKIQSRLKKTNKFNYAQIRASDEIQLGARSDMKLFESPQKIHNIRSEQVLDFYYKNKIKYSTFIFITKKFESSLNNKTNPNFLSLMTELSWESGLSSYREEIISYSWR